MQEIHILTSRMIGQRRQLDMVADNIANVNTTGYKKLDLDFQTVLSKEYGNKVGDYVEDRALTVDYSTGPLTKTDNPYDMAILGEGFFSVNVDGRTEYTRNGNFLLSANNTLVDSRGNPVLDNAGGEIAIPANSLNVTITRDGTIATDEGIVAQVGVFTFPREQMQQLQRTGFGGFTPLPGVAAQPLLNNVSILQGSLESSNVDPTMEVVTMQDLSQKYQSAARLINRIEELESRAIRSLGGSGQ